MQKQKPIIEQSLSERADERTRQESGRNMANVASWLVNIGLGISAFLTIVYLMLLVDAAAGLPSPYGLIFGVLVGIVAIVPAEMALVIWRARLSNEPTITRNQRATAVLAMLAAGVFSALTTSSFFSYFLPQLFPPSYMAIASALNVGAIIGSWIVFILAIVFYGIFSRQTAQNLAQANAYQSVFNARMEVLKSAGEAIRIEAENLVKDMNTNGVFKEDARMLILGSLGMDETRMTQLGDGTRQATLPEPARQSKSTQTGPAQTTRPDGKWYDIVYVDFHGNFKKWGNSSTDLGGLKSRLKEVFIDAGHLQNQTAFIVDGDTDEPLPEYAEEARKFRYWSGGNRLPDPAPARNAAANADYQFIDTTPQATFTNGNGSSVNFTNGRNQNGR